MQVDPLYEALLDDVSKYITKKEDLDKIEKAYLLAKSKHTGQMRRSGEPYIIHPVAVTRILAGLNAGPNTLVAGLLHDIVEDTDVTFDDLTQMFGKDVASLIDGVTKLTKLSFNQEGTQSDNHQKMLLAMARDIRVVIIKIADRLHNMRTLDFMPKDKQVRIASETLEIYAPLAHRLGLFRIKAELEDRSLRYTDPGMYYKVNNLIKLKMEQREHSIELVIENIKTMFKEYDLNQYEIKGRIKNIYSIYKKMVKNNRDFEDIYDLLAVRIIVDKVENCYQALGLIHANYTPIPRRFKDYIAVPKPNLYQSLHTTVLANDGTLFEVQIRTKEMDDIAENGIAAHWAYKENKAYSKEKEQFEIAEKLKWYGELLKMSEDDDDRDGGSESFVETVKSDILSANVYIFTPKGQVVELPKGSTPIDFAFRIHTDLGTRMVGAIVNDRIVPLEYELKTGDIISIKINKNSSGPSDDWLKIAKSSHARHKIKGFLNKKNKDFLVQSGKDQLEKEFIANKITQSLDDNFVKKNFEKNMISTLSDLYHEIGKNTISVKTVINKIVQPEVDKEAMLQKQMEKATRQIIAQSETGVIVDGLTNPQLKLANCCTPVLNDEVAGYVTKGSGIVIHRLDCPNLSEYDKNRLIPAYWGKNVTRKFGTWVKLVGTTRDSLISEVITTINALGISILEMNAVSNTKLESTVKLKVSVANFDELSKLIANLHKVSQVYQIERDIR
ncbi:Guanosine polyphosphate pyrophosphohydrolase/synthetase [Alteracholeplasma palmae J233]|uniref:Penta-phosphate guanosine-3'-pyrophosphohydrolase n=1 Tax=Alteracholeplasma palmae (strain ATCC 49389 / J233) TaxID=1318466 RepID=U4KL87_ALTPJ|nr:bifunctional (p)ppGpp synthetase/guanosine-3',5'-bis(diphosphate) 3'-pyrophosphohydrolase [Alteracholeplasma palmae]CCV64547.1 Guanosine polyphosphate pyrophosphohydrolase/synthetase [Alteracholeplasma palmae J233]